MFNHNKNRQQSIKVIDSRLPLGVRMSRAALAAELRWHCRCLDERPAYSIFPSCQVGNKLVGGNAKRNGRGHWTDIRGIGPLGVGIDVWSLIDRSVGIGGK
jgi:hypothetical protein